MYLYQGLMIVPPIVIGEHQYLDLSWFDHATPDQLAALNITVAPDPVLPDEELYINTINPDGTVTSTPRTADDLAVRLAAAQKKAVAQVYSDVDDIYRDAVGNRTSEYQLAKDQATAYTAAGYTGTVPETVQKWADLNSQTTTWAAQDILASAAQLLAAQLSIRDQRLTCKSQIAAATSVAAVNTVLANWAAYRNAIRSQLGI